MNNRYKGKAAKENRSFVASSESKWLPPLIAESSAPESEEHRRNCLAWHLLHTKTRPEILEWLKQQNSRKKADMRLRLNILRDQVREMRQ
ncbi:hypothetical protein [uncultured Microbulbifer sp.]|uniref:hypothetical protein n=1 Tax=uncultured Microbulbifer sp. TaxID=348147 RepID=UPI00261F64ED|nr:hypothetical protein [uncultured Microbulbifer sp.]